MPQFLVLADDYTDPDALNRRLSVRETHLERMRREREKGHFIVGGAKLSDQGLMQGSMLVISIEDGEAAWRWVNDDPYVTGKVWERIDIIPFRIADV